MATRQPEYPSEFTVENLREIAERGGKGKVKFSRLASFLEGTIKLEDLDTKERADMFRWIRELKTDLNALLNPPAPGIQVEWRTDIPAATLRSRAAELPDGRIRKTLDMFGVLIETGNLDDAVRDSGYTRQHILRLIKTFNKLGIAGLENRSLSEENISDLNKMLLVEQELETRNEIEALLAWTEKGVTSTAIGNRFGMPASSFDRLLEGFLLHGPSYFLSKGDRFAKATVDHVVAARLVELAEKATDTRTKKRCRSVAECLSGRPKKQVGIDYHIKPEALGKLIKALLEHGVFAIIGEDEFERPTGGATAARVRELGSSEQSKERKALILAAAHFYGGAPFGKIEKETGISRYIVYALLWDIQQAGFDKVAEAIEKHVPEPISK